MLNELYTLSGTLSNMGIETKKWHREYKLIPKVTQKAPCYRFWLSDTGKIDRITEVSEEIAAGLRKYGDNQSTFPAFNIVPLYRITDEQKIKELEGILENETLLDIDKVRAWCVCDNWCDEQKELPDINRKAYACAVTRSKTLLDIIEQQDNAAQNSVTRLLSIVRVYSEKAESFREALEACIFEKLSKKESVKICLRLLFHIGNANKLHKNDRGTLSVILDISDWEHYGFPVAHEHSTEWINEMLLQSGSDVSQESEKLDAFGAEYSDVGEPMPGVKLKGFEVTLRSMFNAQRCQYRYGKIDDESYPVAKSNRAATQGSLAWIAKDEHQGFTWQTVDQNEIIFAYPSVLPTIPIKLAALFKPQQVDQGKTEARFVDIASEFMKSIRGLPPKEVPKNMHVFAVRKMDKARTKVVFNRNYSPEWVVDAAKKWQQGCENLPDLDIRMFPLTNQKDTSGDKPVPKRMEPFIPFPLQVPYIVNNVWKQNGELAQGKSGAKRMQYYQGMELLIDPVEKTSVKYYLSVLLTHSTGLILHIGNQQHRRLASSYKQGRDIGFVMSTIGLLLYKYGCEMGDYMESTAYLVGQILKISDELHTLYCNVVRDGEVTAQLAGNSVFVAATEAPVQAFAQLGVRMNPYIAWAKKYQTKKVFEQGKESWRAGWLLRLYEAVFTQLKPLLTDSPRFGDLEKAQVFIGYLAAFPKRENADETDNKKNTTEGDNQNGL